MCGRSLSSAIAVYRVGWGSSSAFLIRPVVTFVPTLPMTLAASRRIAKIWRPGEDLNSPTPEPIPRGSSSSRRRLFRDAAIPRTGSRRDISVRWQLLTLTRRAVDEESAGPLALAMAGGLVTEPPFSDLAKAADPIHAGRIELVAGHIVFKNSAYFLCSSRGRGFGVEDQHHDPEARVAYRSGQRAA